MLDEKGFDTWSGDYDQSILNSNGYPFEGYYEVLANVQKQVVIKDETQILDLGIGTGALTYEMYKMGGSITGLDFSKGMLEKAQNKMPKGYFYDFNFLDGIPSSLDQKQYDYIVSSYAIHHIQDDEKILFLKSLKPYLKSSGKIIIADVAFDSVKERDQVKVACGRSWDDEEFYMIGPDILKALENDYRGVYKKISFCAGILSLELK